MRDEIRKRIDAVRRGEVPEGYQQVDGYVIPEAWHLEAFSNKFKRSVRHNTAACNNVLTISAQLGLVSQKEYYDKDIASEDKSGYFHLRRGEFAYNKSYSSGYPYGAIKRLEKYEEGIVSPLYICFEPNRKTNADFYAHYFEAGLYNREIYRFAQEGARNHGLLNISTEDFFEGALIVPPEEEQQKIADILAASDRVIELKQKCVEELKQLKRSCLAKMFPREGENVPELRFPGFTARWEQRKLGEIATFINGRAYAQPELLTDGKYKVLRVGNFYTNDSWYYSDLELSEKYYADCGDLLYTWSATFGPHIWLGDKVIYHYHIWKIDLSEQLEKYFAVQLLEQDKANLLSNKNGSTMVHITKERMEQKEVIIPPDTDEQETIGAFFRELDNLIALHQRELKDEQQKKKALMQLLITGLVRIPD